MRVSLARRGARERGNPIMPRLRQRLPIPPVSRWLRSMLVVCAGLCWTGNLYAANPTQTENAKPGSPDWQLTNAATNHEIEGYASLTSVNRGGQISFFVNTSDPLYTLELFRMGWYGGLGGRRMTPPIQLSGVVQPIPTPDPTTGLVDCQWSSSYVLTIFNPADPSDWVSGVYLGKLTGLTSGKQSYIVFVVRDDSRASDLLFQTSVTTYQAYNAWGGNSFYRSATHVSFNRPYDNDPLHDRYDGFSVPPRRRPVPAQ